MGWRFRRPDTEHHGSVTSSVTSKRRVLVTGATGFVGRHCIPTLTAAGDEVHGVTSTRPEGEHVGVTWHGVDLTQADAPVRLIAEVQPTHLLHLAWETTHGSFWSSSDNLAWLAASLGLFRAFAEHGGRRAVIAGTCAEYRWNGETCDEETTPTEPTTLYSATKHALHIATEVYARQTGVSLAWARVFFVYGPGEKSTRLVPSVVLPLLRGEPAACSHGRQVRDFLHVDDVASIFTTLLASDVEGSVNVGSGVPTTVAKMVEMIAEIIGRPDLIRFGAVAAPPGDPAFVVASVRRLTEELGWHPRHDLRSGLRQTIDWWREAAV
jgi:nucleoside-diphosphate-sugar epimerase